MSEADEMMYIDVLIALDKAREATTQGSPLWWLLTKKYASVVRDWDRDYNGSRELGL